MWMRFFRICPHEGQQPSYEGFKALLWYDQSHKYDPIGIEEIFLFKLIRTDKSTKTSIFFSVKLYFKFQFLTLSVVHPPFYSFTFFIVVIPKEKLET